MPENHVNHSKNQLIGVVACGGASSRMGTDKCQLIYCEKPQYLEVATLLRTFCDHVVISCRSSQVTQFSEMEIMPDLAVFENSGPIAAVLTAFKCYPKHDVLLVGCDYPWIALSDLAKLVASEYRSTAAALFNEDTGFYEPLLAYYPINLQGSLLEMHSGNNNSLQQFLLKNNARKVAPIDAKNIRSVDTLSEYIIARKSMR